MALSYLPTDNTITPTHDRFKSCDTFAAQFVLDRPIVTVIDFLALGNLNNNEATSELTLTGTGNAVFTGSTNFGTSLLTAPKMDADSESFSVLWTLPADLDPDQAIDFRIWWSNSQSAATGSATWTIAYTIVNSDTTALTAPGSTALDTVLTGQADLATGIPQWTPWGSIAASTAAVQALTPGDDGLLLLGSVNLTTITDAYPLKVQARYYRRLLG